MAHDFPWKVVCVIPLSESRQRNSSVCPFEAYQEIKDYVLEHSSLKVSSLYIAQVKQKCSIIERENYNKPKSEDSKQPQCPPDKEKAIKKALKHFGMI